MIASFEMAGIVLLDPWFLLVLPLAGFAFVLRQLRPRAALPTASLALFAAAPRTLRQRCAFLPRVLALLAAASLGIAMARPVERKVAPIREQGIDIVLSIDTSSSMEIPDMDQAMQFPRMDAARERAQAFAAARKNDRVGLVTFARFAELRCPPTLDEKALAAFLRDVQMVPKGSELDRTAIGIGLGKAVQVLQKSQAKSRVVVLLSDGQNNIEDVLPVDAAKLAKDAGIRVHTIGLGNGMPTFGGFQPLDFKDLRVIAETTGGQFFQPKSDADLGEVYARIDELEKTELADPRYRMVDRFEWPLGVGLALLLLALLLDALLFRRVP